MKTRLLLVIFSIGFIGLTELPVAQSLESEKINGIPVYRGIGCFAAFPKTIDGLAEASDLVVIANIKQSIEAAKAIPDLSIDGIPTADFSTSEVQGEIRKVYKGDPKLKGQTIPIRQHAIMRRGKDRKPYISALEDYQPFKQGRYLLFLKRGLNIRAYFPMGLNYGKHNIDGTDNSEDFIKDETYITLHKDVKQRFKERESVEIP